MESRKLVHFVAQQTRFALINNTELIRQPSLRKIPNRHNR